MELNSNEDELDDGAGGKRELVHLLTCNGVKMFILWYSDLSSSH